MDKYVRELNSLLKSKEKLRIVQIGAYDGIAGDPIYSWVIEHKPDILLIEPQAEAVKRLRENYSSHPGAVIWECAISNEPSGMLEMTAAEGRGWGSGSTVDVDYREKFAKARGMGPGRWGAFVVKCMTLQSALAESGFGKPVDVLQVDCEGYDDEAIYASDIGRLRPAIINYEFDLMNRARQEKLRAYLTVLGYKIRRWKYNDEMATLNG